MLRERSRIHALRACPRPDGSPHRYGRSRACIDGRSPEGGHARGHGRSSHVVRHAPAAGGRRAPVLKRDLLLVYEQKTIGPSYGVGQPNKDSQVLWRTQVHTHHAVEVVKDSIYALTELCGRPRLTLARLTLPVRPTSMKGLASSILMALNWSTDSILEAMANTRIRGWPKWFRRAAVSIRCTPIRWTFSPRQHVSFREPNPAMSPVAEKSGHVGCDDLEMTRLSGHCAVAGVSSTMPEMLPNGHILLFDNEGGLMRHGGSRVLEIDPRTAGVVWSFCGTDSNPLDSEVRGGAQRLIGGNTLISDPRRAASLKSPPMDRLYGST